MIHSKNNALSLEKISKLSSLLCFLILSIGTRKLVLADQNPSFCVTVSLNSIDNNKADRSGVEESLVEDSNKEIGSSISAAHVPNCYFSDLFDAALQEAQDSLNRC